MEWGEQEALPGRCELGPSGRSPSGTRHSREKCMLGAEQGKGLGQSGRPRQESTPPSGMPAPSHPPSARRDGAGEIIHRCWHSLCSGNIIIPGGWGLWLPPPGSPCSLTNSKVRILGLLLDLIISFVLGGTRIALLLQGCLDSQETGRGDWTWRLPWQMQVIRPLCF